MERKNDVELLFVINVNGREHVVKESTRTGMYTDPETGEKGRESIPSPNYRDTGYALCGVLDKNETFFDWKKRTGRTFL